MKLSSVFGALLSLLLATSAHATHGPRVSTQQGRLEGKLSADGQVRDFLGIPYAAPPIGPLRWKPPQPAAGWRGIRPAIAFGNRCMQLSSSAMVFRDTQPSENCLTLNVWTPARHPHALPVMVWIYGGGFQAGSNSEPGQDGENLAHHGVVVVSINYRLGIFGFFATAQLAAESPYHAAGNYGLMDQTAALRWVQRNIAAFGGDPHNVTLFGESAGSYSVSAQMASPLARGLFVRAIGESGAAFAGKTLQFLPLAATESEDEAFARSSFGSTSLTSLRGLSADALLRAASMKAHGVPRFMPDVDGWFLPESVPAIFAAGHQARIPLLAGWNKDEGTPQIVRSPSRPTVASLHRMAEKQFGTDADAFLHAYAATTDAEAVRVAEDFAGDTFIAYTTWAWIEAHAETGEAPVYRYYFALGSPGDPHHPSSFGAFHGDEVVYVFGNLDAREGAHWRPEDRTLSELMQAYWTNFARTGDPNAPGLPPWPRYNAAGEWPVMRLDPDPRAQPDRHRDRYLFLRKVWGVW